MDKIDAIKNNFNTINTAAVVKFSYNFLDGKINKEGVERDLKYYKENFRKKGCNEKEIEELIDFLIEEAKKHAKYIDSIHEK